MSKRSAMALAFFGRVFDRTLVRDFHSLRMLRQGERPSNWAKRIVVYANHPSWWDGVLYVVLARRLFADYTAYAPIDAEMLKRYPLLGRLGAFGVDQHSLKGAADFAETCTLALGREGSMLFIAAQGRFADVRERPLALSPGLAHLADIAPDTMFLPLAVEMAFWFEKRPELLIAFGRPIMAAELSSVGKSDRISLLEERLGATMDRLGDASIARRSADFEVLMTGRSQINAVYDAWRRLAALARGQTRFNPGHGSEEP